MNTRGTLLLLLLVSVFTTNVTSKKIVCYVPNWSLWGDFFDNIDPTLCTHFVYSFMQANSDGSVRVGNPHLDLPDGGGKDGYRRIVALKTKNPGAKVMIAIGGGSDEAPSSTYSALAGSQSARNAFVENIYKFLIKHKFDGLDFDWEFPAIGSGNANTDKGNFVTLLRQLREKFVQRSPPFLLSAAVSAVHWSADQSYDVPGLNTHLDFINVMAYDYHGFWDKSQNKGVGINAPLRPMNSQDNLNVESGIKYWISRGATPSKLILGMATYGRSFTLSNAANNKVGASFDKAGAPGPDTHDAGSLSYTEICSNRWTEVWYGVQEVPYAYNGDQWVGYDNPRSIQLKTKYAVSQGLGGAMVWSMQLDDYKGKCGGPKFPLLRTIKQNLV